MSNLEYIQSFSKNLFWDIKKESLNMVILMIGNY